MTGKIFRVFSVLFVVCFFSLQLIAAQNGKVSSVGIAHSGDYFYPESSFGVKVGETLQEFAMKSSSGVKNLYKPKKKGKPGEIASLLPADTDMLFILKSMENFFNYLPLNSKNFGGRPLSKERRNNIIKKLGFNPLSKKELLDSGFDLNREVGVAFADTEIVEPNDFASTTLFCLPVLDGDRAMETMRKIIVSSHGKDVSFVKNGQIIQVIMRENPISLNLALNKKYLFVSLSFWKDSLPLLNKVIEGKSSLVSDNFYTEVASKIDIGEEIFFYMNAKKILKIYTEKYLDSLPFQGPGAEMYRFFSSLSKASYGSYRGFGMNLDFSSGELILKSVSNLEADSPVLKLYENITFDREPLLGQGGNPLVLFSLGLNMEELFSYMFRNAEASSLENINSLFKDFKSKYKINFKKEIIDNMAGTFNMGLYDGASLTRNHVNLFITFNVKNSQVMNKVMGKLKSSLPHGMVKKVGRSPHAIYEIKRDGRSVFLACKNNIFVLSFSKKVLEEVQGAKWSKSFLNKMPYKNIAKDLKARDSMLYLDGGEFRRAMRNFMAVDSPKYHFLDEFLSNYRYLFMLSEAQGNSIYSTLEVRTIYDMPFFNGIADSIVKISDANKGKK